MKLPAEKFIIFWCKFIYASANLWQIHGAVGLPLEPFLVLQALLTEHLEASMLPGSIVESVDEPANIQALRRQLKQVAEQSTVAGLFCQVLHLQPRQSNHLPLRRMSRAYQRHCSAVALHEVSPRMVEALCRIYSTLLAKARASTRASQQTSCWSQQVFHGLANAIAYMEAGDAAKILWRFALAFYDWRRKETFSKPIGCYHVLHLQAIALSQLLSVMSREELNSDSSPLRERDLTDYISLVSRLVASMIFASSGEADAPVAKVLPSGLFLDAFLEHVGKVLSQLHIFAGRQPPDLVPPRQAWHAPSDVISAFKRILEQALHAIASGERTQSQRLSLFAERLLRYVPHSIPFEQRVVLLRTYIHAVRQNIHGRPLSRVVIRRTHLFEDGLTALAEIDWHSCFQVVFVNEAGHQEQGVDAGGLFKEFWEKLAETAFNPDYGLFRATESSRLLFPNPDASNYHAHTNRLFEFLGLVIGKAIFESIVVEPCFAPFFLAKLLGRHNTYYDLQSLDPSLFANLQRLKTYEGSVADLCCSFVVSTSDGREVPLLPGGDHMSVTNDNRFRYIYLLADYKLNAELNAGSSAFRAGFHKLIDERWIRIFDEDELQQVISGTQRCNIDVDDLQKHTHHPTCSGPKDKLLVDFFAALRAMTPKQHVQLLRFVTSCSRTPLLGFGNLIPPFTVQKVPIRNDSERLPTASTCFNTLKLPTYSNWKVMKQKLEYAIEQAAGFELD